MVSLYVQVIAVPDCFFKLLALYDVSETRYSKYCHLGHTAVAEDGDSTHLLFKSFVCGSSQTERSWLKGKGLDYSEARITILRRK